MILITGASNGIGEFLYNKYKELGCEVIGTYNKTYKKGLYQLDVTNFDEVEEFINKITKDKIILISCSGITYDSFAHKADIEKWKQVIDVNLVGTYNVIRCLLPHMRKNNYGRIINFSSVVAQIHVNGTSAYAASKSALWGMAKAISSENSRFNITINNINLGYFDIGMGSMIPTTMKNTIKEKTLQNSFGKPIEILKTVDYLIESNYLTGTTIDLSGGLI